MANPQVFIITVKSYTGQAFSLELQPITSQKTLNMFIHKCYEYTCRAMNKISRSHHTQRVPSVWWLIQQPQIALWCELNHYACKKPLSTASEPQGQGFHTLQSTISFSTHSRGSNRRGKSAGLAWKQGGMWENVNEFPKTKRRKYPQYTSEWGCVIMCTSNLPFIPASDYSEFHFIIIVRWNEWPVGIAHNYTTLFRSILGVLSPFSSWKFINET